MRAFFDVFSGKSISGRLAIAASVLTVAIGILVFGAYRTADRLIEMEHESNQLSIAMRNHVESDMMHDAMRATVLSSIQAGLTQNAEQAATARADLQEYSGWLDRLHGKTAALDLPQDTVADLEAVEEDFKEYVALVEAVVAVAPENPALGIERKVAHDVKFREMEVSNEAASDRLEAKVNAKTAALEDELSWIIILVEIGAVILLALVGGFVWYMRRTVVSPLARIALELEAEKPGSLEEEQARADEIGDLARSVAAFREASDRIRESEAATASALKEAKDQAERKRALAATAEALEARTIGVVEQVTHTAAQLKTIADALANSAGLSQQETTSAAAAAEQTINGVVAIAQATDELLVSIQEVSTRINVVAKSGEEARNLAHSTESTISELNDMTKQVSSFTVLIGEIAQRSNLLALNATIEAAHAGDAGSGFAVVAGEVKQLAQQTGQAVEEIDAKIRAMTTITENAVASLAGMATAINELGSATTSIASAAEQQSLATSEIGRTIETSSQGTESMRGNLQSVDAQVSDTARSAQEVRAATVLLDEQAAELSREIAEFIARAKAA